MGGVVADYKVQIDRILADESKSVGKAFANLEAKTGVKRTYLFYSSVGIITLWLAFGYAAQLLCNTIGFAYPAYVSMHAIETARADDDKRWLTYWVVFAVFSVLEFFVDFITSWIPLYWLAKCIFLVWLMAPGECNGATILYNRVIRPYFLQHRNAVDAALDKGAKAASKLLNKDQ